MASFFQEAVENLFGFEIKRKGKQAEVESNIRSIVPPEEDGATTVIDGGIGHYAYYRDIDGDAAPNDNALIIKYRQAALQPECDQAIEDIVNEAIIFDEASSPVDINLDDLDQPDSIKNAIREEFNRVLELLQFNFNGFDTFRKWYIDGRLFYHIIIDEKSPKRGIQELRPIDPLQIRKIREVKEEKDPKTGVSVITGVEEYFIFSRHGISAQDSGMASVKISKDAILFVSSGYTDVNRRRVLSPLHKALKPVNQLRWMEDSLVIYRLSRAPERRIFYIDTGNLPKGKAEEYVQSIMKKYRNKIVYDASTGELRSDTKHMNMLEDFWLPRKEGGRGTEITTLPGGSNLSDIDDVLFFRRKLYRALNVPISRMEPETQFSLGRGSEITRDELKFQKFINKLRKKFSLLFMEALRTQLIVKGVIMSTEWPEIQESINIDYLNDSQFTELKNLEIMTERIRIAQEITPFIGKFFSNEWVRRNILRLSEDEIREMKKQIAAEKSTGEYNDGEDSDMSGGSSQDDLEPEDSSPDDESDYDEPDEDDRGDL